MGVPDGWRERLAARVARRQARGVPVGQRRQARGSGRRHGLPKAQAWWTVKRQAMTTDHVATVGVYFGTTSGEVWGSRDEGRDVEVPRAAPAAHLRGRSRLMDEDIARPRHGVRVLVPGLLALVYGGRRHRRPRRRGVNGERRRNARRCARGARRALSRPSLSHHRRAGAESARTSRSSSTAS